MQGHQETLDMYNVAMNSAGTTQQKYNKYLQSTEAYLERLQSTYTGIWQNVFTDADMRTGISLVTSLVSGLGKLIEMFGLLPTIVPIATGVLMIFNAQVRSLAVSAGYNLVSSLGALGVKMLSLATSTGIASVAMAGFIKVALPLLAIAAVTFAVTKLAGEISKASEEARIQRMEQENNVQAYKENGEEIDKLVARYKELSKAISRTAEEDEELEKVKQKLAQMLPGVTTKLDAHGDVHIRTAEKIDEELTRLRELLGTYEELDKVLKDQEKTRLEAQIRYTQDTLMGLQRELDNMTLNPDLSPGADMLAREQAIGASIDRLSKKLADLQEQYGFIMNPKSKVASGSPSTNDDLTRGESPANSFLAIFDLSLRKLELVNAELDRLKDSLELVTDQEQRQTIYDQMIDAYKQKQTLLAQMLTWQKQELANAQTILRGSVSSSDYAKIISGDFSNLSVGNEATSKAIENFQRLASEVLKTESSLREVEIAYTRLGDTANQELQSIIEKQTNLAFYLIDKEINELQRLKEAAQDVAQTKIDAIEAEIEALEATNKLVEEQEERERRVNELIELQIRLRNVLKEKNVQVLQKQADGSYQFAYVADQEKIDDINKEIQQKQEDMAKWESDLRKRKEIEELRDEIKAIRDQLKIDQDGYDKRIRNLQDFKTLYNETQSEFYGQIIAGLQGLIDDIADVDELGYGERIARLKSHLAEFAGLVGATPLPSGGMGNVPSSVPSSSMTLRDYAGGANVGWDDKTGNVTINGKPYSPSQLQNAGLQLKDGRWQGTESQLRQALGFKYGGVADFTGPTNLHASPSSVETIFNATDGKKLFNFVHSLPQRLLNMPTPTAPLLSGKSGAGTIMNVYPQFPNVTDGNQIIKAIQGLPRLATQLAPNPV